MLYIDLSTLAFPMSANVSAVSEPRSGCAKGKGP